MSVEEVHYNWFICDRCGSKQKIARLNYYSASCIRIVANATFPQCGGESRHDLCGDCWGEFLVFMKALKEMVK